MSQYITAEIIVAGDKQECFEVFTNDTKEQTVGFIFDETLAKKLIELMNKETTPKHTEDCLDANDDTSVLKGPCICPNPIKENPYLESLKAVRFISKREKRVQEKIFNK